MQGICSIDLREDAVACCGCTFPLPSLCEACKAKHSEGPGLHYLLPLSALQVIKSQRQLMQLQPRLVQLSNTYKEAYAILPQIDRCADLIESVYQEILHSAEELKVQYQEKLTLLKQGYIEAVDKAIQETSLHAFEGQTYVPKDPLARLMWEDDLSSPSGFVKFEYSIDCFRSHLSMAFQVAFRTSLPSLEHLNVGQLAVQELVNPIEMQSFDSVKALNPTGEIYIKTRGGKVTVLGFSGSTESIEDLKRRIQDKEGIKSENQTLIFKGKILEDSRTLGSYNIEAGSKLHLVFKFSRE